MDSTEMYIEIDKAKAYFGELKAVMGPSNKNTVNLKFSPEFLINKIDAALWHIKDCWGYTTEFEEEFYSLIKEFVNNTDIKLKL